MIIVRVIAGLGRTAIVCVSVAAMLVACSPPRTPQHYLLPDGFTGWVYVKYDDPTCPPLNVRDGRQVLRIPANGRLCTATRYKTGSAQDLWEYVRVDGSTQALNRNTDITPSGLSRAGAFREFPGRFGTR